MNLTKGNQYRIIEPGSENYGRVGTLSLCTKNGLAVLVSQELSKSELNRILQKNPNYSRPCEISMVCHTKYLEEVNNES